MIVDIFKKYKPEDPLRKVCNVDQQNKIANVLNTIQGVNCRIVKTASGLGWTIIVDGGSDVIPDDGNAEGWPQPFGGGSSPDGEYEVVTDIRYDGGTHKLQKKVMTITIENGRAEYEEDKTWYDITQAQACPT